MTPFADSFHLDSRQATALLRPVTERYGSPLPVWPGIACIEIGLALSQPTGDLWQSAAVRERSRNLPIMAAVSEAVQETLRTWLPLLELSSIDRFDDYKNAATIISYAALRTYTPRSATAYTFDVLDSDTPRAIVYSLQRTVPGRLAELAPMLTELNPKAAHAFAPRRMERILETYQRDSHPLHSLLVAERDLVEAFAKRLTASESEGASSECQRRVERRLRRLLPGRDVTAWYRLFEMEAARAAAGVMREKCGWTAIFSANIPPNIPLVPHEGSNLADSPGLLRESVPCGCEPA